VTADFVAEAPRRVVLDNRRTPCAVGLIKADNLMQELEPGTQLEIWSRDVFAPMEVKLWAEKSGYELESHVRAGVWPHRHHVLVVTR
jgi:tRNA 2-thiouridine synthesizing protein A